MQAVFHIYAMEIGSAEGMKTGFWAWCLQLVANLVARCAWCLKLVANLVARSLENADSVVKKVKKIGKDDPRRIVHSLKVGLAITLVSIFYYLKPLYNAFGVNAMWAVLTVVIVFEFTVGATLSKGLNRIFATASACALAVGIHHLANISGERGGHIILGASVFLIAVATTFARFFPKIKARYDYGMLIFILTFSFIAVSGYRNDSLITMAHQRVSTIAIGSLTCVIISICIFPVWAGEDLHKMVALNLEKLANFLEGFGDENLKKEEGEIAEAPTKNKLLLEAYKSILNTNTSEDSLANFAWWEPHHGPFRFHHPWDRYLKIGALARQCAYFFEALNACTSSNIQAPLQFQQEVQEACRKMCSESRKALMELSSAIRTTTKPIGAGLHVADAKIAADELKTALKTTSSEITARLDILKAANIALLLVEIVAHVEKLVLAVDELAQVANFKNPASVAKRTPSVLHQGVVKPLSEDVIIVIPELESSSPENASF